MRRDIPLSRFRSLPESNQGLTRQEYLKRQKQYGLNNIIESGANPWFELAKNTSKDPMIWFLIATGLIYAGLGSHTEAITLLIAIVPLVSMDAFLHRRAQASTESLGQQLAQNARVLRDSVMLNISATDLVPGDLVLLAAGESFPADGLILRGDDLQADESSLTGEAFPVTKRPLTTLPRTVDNHEHVIWIDSDQWGLAGTRLLTGTAELRVVFTGKQTLYGEIVHAAMSSKGEKTPLQHAIANLVTLLMVSAAIMCFILAAVRLHQGYDWIDALISAVTLAVAALPEEFPVVFTVFLGVGVYRLARQKVLVRQSVSVENIGRVTCVCSDKTGTLTEGRLRLEHLVAAEGITEQDLLYWASLASRKETGDPMDMAILERFTNQPCSIAPGIVLATYPYTEQRRRETTIIRVNGRIIAVSKGSPEMLLEMSNLTLSQRSVWLAQVNQLAATSHKVLACLRWDIGEFWAGGEPDQNGQFAGLLACEDPIRPGVIDAIRQCRDASIRVIMVTGDHPVTAASVAREIGLIDQSDGVVLGDELVLQLEQGNTAILKQLSVVARAMPMQKLSLVQALKAKGEIVAVTGDGVNDVPALQSADIGIAMGERGTRSAREVASIVLLQDNFNTIVRAIAEGRQLFRNLQLSFQYILLMHIPLVITAIFIPLMGYPILYLPIHIVWYETIIHPTALLVFQELPTQGPLKPIRKRQAARFFSRTEWSLIAITGTLLTLFILWSYHRSLFPGQNIEHARAMTMAILGCASASATALLSGLRTFSARLITCLTLVFSVMLVQIPWLASYLSLWPLHLDDWLIAATGGFLCVALPIGLFSIGAELKWNQGKIK